MGESMSETKTKLRLKTKWIGAALLLAAPFAQATSSGDDFVPGRSFLTVKDVAANVPSLLSAYQEAFGALAIQNPSNDQTQIDLLSWIRTRAVPPRPREAYNRNGQFGTWMDPQSDRFCFNVRGLVLIRDSQRPVTTIPGQACFVNTGLWHDPYTNKMVTQAKALQIDHVVPLKNAYISGGFNWDWKTRCAYANFMGNRFHLLAVDGPANMEKGDQTPVDFIPPNRGFTCEYLADWLKIKMIWRLMMSEQEGIVISKVLQSAGCNPNDFKFTTRDLAIQRQAIAATRNECPETPTQWRPDMEQ